MKHRTVRNIVLNYVEANGPATWTELHKVVLIAAGQPLTRKNWGLSYLGYKSSNSCFFPTTNENRYLYLDKSIGKYQIATMNMSK